MTEFIDRVPRPPTTTDAGIPVASEEHSLTVGRFWVKYHFKTDQGVEFLT